MPDGALSMKFGWDRKHNGRLTIEGKRLDSRVSPLRATIPEGYGDIGFQSTALIFSSVGCWQVVGHLGADQLEFVVFVERIEGGPH